MVECLGRWRSSVAAATIEAWQKKSHPTIEQLGSESKELYELLSRRSYCQTARPSLAIVWASANSVATEADAFHDVHAVFKADGMMLAIRRVLDNR
jgi:predicted lipoprotein